MKNTLMKTVLLFFFVILSLTLLSKVLSMDGLFISWAVHSHMIYSSSVIKNV
jgi:hypothetical protein